MSFANRLFFIAQLYFSLPLFWKDLFYLLLDLKKLFLSKLKSYICLIFDLLFSYSLFKVLA